DASAIDSPSSRRSRMTALARGVSRLSASRVAARWAIRPQASAGRAAPTARAVAARKASERTSRLRPARRRADETRLKAALKGPRTDLLFDSMLITTPALVDSGPARHRSPVTARASRPRSKRHRAGAAAVAVQALRGRSRYDSIRIDGGPEILLL